jgi:hypothetical protein
MLPSAALVDSWQPSSLDAPLWQWRKTGKGMMGIDKKLVPELLDSRLHASQKVHFE